MKYFNAKGMWNKALEDMETIPQTQEEFNNCSFRKLNYMATNCSKNGIDDYKHLLGMTKTFKYQPELYLSYDSGLYQKKTTVRLIGLNHDVTESGKVVGFTFQFFYDIPDLFVRDVYDYDTYPVIFSCLLTTANVEMLNANLDQFIGWDKCDFRVTNKQYFLQSLPPDLVKYMKTVKKNTNVTGTGSDTVVTYDDIFPLSYVEITGTEEFSGADVAFTLSQGPYIANEGTQYEYFKEVSAKGDATATMNSPVCYSGVTGNGIITGTRSLYPQTNYFCMWYENMGEYPLGQNLMGYVPAFCFCLGD